MNDHMPFAVVGSREELVINNQKVRAREYPWGVVEVENENHCDFVKLREMLIRTNMEDLRERTHTVSRTADACLCLSSVVRYTTSSTGGNSCSGWAARKWRSLSEEM